MYHTFRTKNLGFFTATLVFTSHSVSSNIWKMINLIKSNWNWWSFLRLFFRRFFFQWCWWTFATLPIIPWWWWYTTFFGVTIVVWTDHLVSVRVFQFYCNKNKYETYQYINKCLLVPITENFRVNLRINLMADKTHRHLDRQKSPSNFSNRFVENDL